MVTTDNGQTPTPDVATLDGVIQQAVAQLQGVYQLLPDFVPAPADGVKAMRAARSFTDDFLEASAVAAENGYRSCAGFRRRFRATDHRGQDDGMTPPLFRV